ncbi:Hypothetical predicted protein [Marmota monax]|uniref:Uncharacterized protein n=1 Tax=Marmota monax TaxID=9995 RepID=A0A5E4AXC9_MARMO|nr:hypothetical protein GHT09_018368 [Marmota monax]VTJ61189.1 Hypothetical predicted protein [Marmota monax]
MRVVSELDLQDKSSSDGFEEQENYQIQSNRRRKGQRGEGTGMRTESRQPQQVGQNWRAVEGEILENRGWKDVQIPFCGHCWWEGFNPEDLKMGKAIALANGNR